MFVRVSTFEILNVAVLEFFFRAIDVRHADGKEVWPQTSDGVLGNVRGEL
jgi:hypothetical protein